MKTRTEDEILDLLDEEFAWRRKELTSIAADLASSGGRTRPVLLRAGTALLYAHWEGFIKSSADAYVDFVARRRPRYQDLCPGFLVLALRSRLSTLMSTEDASAHLTFVDFILNNMGSSAQLPRLGVIKTGSNLNSRRLKAIVLTLGLDYAPFELKENLIDTQLLDARNKIAHGKLLYPTYADFEHLNAEISALLRNFKDQISNAVVTRRYLRA
jgi:hypothetical protein